MWRLVEDDVIASTLSRVSNLLDSEQNLPNLCAARGIAAVQQNPYIRRIKGERSGPQKKERPVIVQLLIDIARRLRRALAAVFGAHLKAHQRHQENFGQFPME